MATAELANPDHLQAIAAAFARSGALHCLGRPQPLDESRANPLQKAIAAARNSRLGHHPDSFIYSAEERFVSPQSVAVAYRRDVFERVGLFDETFDACEDVEFNHRVARGAACGLLLHAARRRPLRTAWDAPEPVPPDDPLRAWPGSSDAKAPRNVLHPRLRKASPRLLFVLGSNT